jgi:DNA ligase (NAD+)
MLSLDKVTDPETLLKFVGKNKFTLRSKIDGGSLELRYRDGLLTEAVSRGRSGALGFVCTNNALCLLDVPHVITGFTGEIRGEVVMTWTDFKNLPQEMKHLSIHAMWLLEPCDKKIQRSFGIVKFVLLPTKSWVITTN